MIFSTKGILSILFVGVILVLIGQYFSPQIALGTAGIILLSTLVLNIDKIKELAA